MKKKIALFFLLLPSLLFAQQLNIIPQPVSIQQSEGNFVIDNNTAVSFNAMDKNLQAAANFFIAHIRHISGIGLPSNTRSNKTIQLKIAATEGIGDEGYLLHVSPSSIIITANTKTGIVYAMQTVFQTLPAIRTNAVLQVPCMDVKDYPRFTWRGMHLDVCRHFFGPDFVKEYIDLLAAYKMNVFHWHLTDDQGWRIEIKKYPKLTSVGAWRVDETNKPWGDRPQATKDETPTYGGYYTQEQIKDIIKYAQERNVTIVPEIEMPGHCAAAIAAYPFLSCPQKPQLPMTGGNYANMSSVFCVGNDSVFSFLENVLTEVINLFPSPYIHIGGDEVDKTSWKNCDRCQALKNKEGLKNEDELQSYFIKRIEKFIVNKHRKMIGWDEILEGGLAPEATVMSWRGESGGIAAAKQQHDVVMTPGTPLYFDHYQANPATEPPAIGGFNTLKMVYDYNPVPKELEGGYEKYILGAQANLWTEYITTAQQVQYMVVPRLLALAEVDWTPESEKNWDSFNKRLQTQFKAFGQKGIVYCKGNFTPGIQPSVQNGKLFATLSTEAYNGEMYYTLDNSTPTLQSQKYTAPVAIESSVTLKAITVVDGNIMNTIPAQQSFVMDKAVGKNVVYTNPVSKYYMADGPNSLTDGVRGTDNVSKYWHGFSGKDLIATIDLGEEENIHEISIGCLQHYRDWIMMPQWVKFEVSNDGKDFTEIKTINNTIALNELSAIKDFVADFPEQKARYIRVTAKALDALPKGHPGEGQPAWIFTDEIIVR
ncbi:MAG TPA: family 20 glycosylhydrolase [Parafilimonas sp.]|nr:family 20 glycosylhydrolase [Parafilimonas sp.]